MFMWMKVPEVSESQRLSTEANSQSPERYVTCHYSVGRTSLGSKA